MLKAISSDFEDASQEYANNQRSRRSCARASRLAVLHRVYNTVAMSSPDICIKPLRKRFPLKTVFQNPMRFFLRWNYLIFHLSEAPIHFFKKQKNKISTQFKITPNATKISGHFLSNYSKSCSSSSFTTEPLTNRMQGDICTVNQTIYRFPKLHTPVSPPYRTVIQTWFKVRIPHPIQYRMMPIKST